MRVLCQLLGSGAISLCMFSSTNLCMRKAVFPAGTESGVVSMVPVLEMAILEVSLVVLWLKP